MHRVCHTRKGAGEIEVCKDFIFFALLLKIHLRGRDTAAHWLDYAQPKYHDSLIVGVKSLIAVFVLFIPVVFFWALFDQQVLDTGREFIAFKKLIKAKNLLFYCINLYLNLRVVSKILFLLQGSTWVLQARRMDGRVGPLTILPDQMNTVNPLMIILLVPIFEAFIYPGLRKVCNITPLRKMAVGGLLASLAFLLAGLVQVTF